MFSKSSYPDFLRLVTDYVTHLMEIPILTKALTMGQAIWERYTIYQSHHLQSWGFTSGLLYIYSVLIGSAAKTQLILIFISPSFFRLISGLIFNVWFNSLWHALKISGTSLTFVFQCQGRDLIPVGAAKILYDSQPKNQNIKQKQYCNKFNKGYLKKKRILESPHQLLF